MPKGNKVKSTGIKPKIEVVKKLTLEQSKELLVTLKTRFEQNIHRHRGVVWKNVQAKLEARPEKLISILAMESTGGEPDVVSADKKTGEFVFMDCSTQSPEGRRSLCYDRQALDARKASKPGGSAMEWAKTMGIELLNEEQYRQLQQTGEYDTKTSSWIHTPEEVRKLGGALFGDRRFGRVFVYHNGAESYYAVRGFRGWVGV